MSVGRNALSILSFFSIILFQLPVMGIDYKPIQDGSIHEAYVTAVRGVDFLDAVPNEPPKSITERIPEKRDPESEWIGGNWAWDKDRADFLWVSGVWRRSPPGHEWIQGEWKKFDEGWVWIRGFWSATPERRLTYIEKSPPDAPDQNPGPPPSDNHFWNPGYWHYTAHNDTYTWVIGAWEPLDPNWILVPAHYVWRENGYVFIPAYWDWPFDDRGRAYSCIWIEPAARPTFIYDPVVIIEPIMVIRHLFCCYPDYSCYFFHHHHFHPYFWDEFYGTPPWWGWSEWWCYSWHDMWGLWWWWGNPGYPQPWWIDAGIAGIIAPPPGAIIIFFNGLFPPIFITPNGMVFPADILNAISQLLFGGGAPLPLIPFNQDLIDKIQDKVEPKGKGEGILKPTGKKPPPANVKKPVIDPKALDNIPTDTIGTPLPPIPGGGEVEPTRPDRPEIRPVPPRATTPAPPRYTPPPRWERPQSPRPRPQWERPRPHHPPQQWETPRPHQPPQWQRPQPHRPPGGGINIPDIIDSIRDRHDDHNDSGSGYPGQTGPGRSEMDWNQTRPPTNQSSPGWNRQSQPQQIRQFPGFQQQMRRFQPGPGQQQKGGRQQSQETWQGEIDYP